MIELALHYLPLLWIISGFITLILYSVDIYFWKKDTTSRKAEGGEHGGGSFIMIIPMFAGGPIVLALQVIELIGKGGFGRGREI